jgi:ATP-dependent protease HslVU (ClpYQ) peptidase subunit
MNGPGGGGGKFASSAHTLALSKTTAAEVATVAMAVASCFLLNKLMLVFLPD